MKRTSVKRRHFLQSATGLLGAASLANFQFLAAGAAETKSPLEVKARQVSEKIFKEMDKDGRGYLCLPRTDGELLSLLVRAARARSVLELGTSIGSAAIWLALGLEETGGKLTTVEILEDRVQLAKTNLEQAGLSRRVTFKQGDAHQIVPNLEGPFDFVLLAADKEGLVDYFNKLYPKKLPPGAMLLANNAIRQQDKMEDYLKLVNKHADFDTVILSATMVDGFAVSYRRRK